MNNVKKVLGWLKRWLLDNFWMKIFALVLAMALWSYVLTNDTTITRERTLTNLYVSTTNQSTIDSRGLALTESLSDILPQVRVSVEVTQNDYYRITTNNVRVELDLSRIRETGEQTVPLTASSVYGTVTGIYPDSITLDVDELEERNVQVEIDLSGTNAERWYSNPTSNPSIITVTGPASQVEQVASARAVMDVSGVDTAGNITRAVSYKLLNSRGKEVTFPTLGTSTSSVITSVEAYPLEDVRVESDPAKIINGSVAPGYKIDSIEIQPSTVSVAASQRFLDQLDTAAIYSINVTDMSETTTKTTRINRQSEMKYVSTDEVLVTIHISEKQLTRSLDSLTPAINNLEPGLALTNKVRTCTVTVTGPYGKVSALSRDDINIYADAYGLTEGEYDLPVQASLEDASDMEITVEPRTVKVTIQ